MKEKCKISKATALCIVELQLFKVEELDVCGNLVWSNPVTIIHFTNFSKVDIKQSIHAQLP